MNDAQLFEIFITETEGNIETLEKGLLVLEDNPDDDEEINLIFRAAHTIKGSSAIVGMHALERFTHILEHVLERVRSHELSIDSEIISALLAAVDRIKDMLSGITSGAPINNDINIECVSLNQYLDPHFGNPPAEETGEAEHLYVIDLEFRNNIFNTGLDPEMIIAELRGLGELLEVETDLARLPAFPGLKIDTLYLRWRILLKSSHEISRIKDVFLFVIDDNPIHISEVVKDELPAQAQSTRELTIGKQPKPSEPAPSGEGALPNSVLRLDVAKLDDIVNLVGEFVIEVSQAGHMLRDGSQSAHIRIAAADSLDKRCRELRENVLALRMLPVGNTFSRFHRIVRDLSRDLSKKIRLKTYGTDIELDKNVADHLIDPLTHLVRNAVHHGIETPSERLVLGKQEYGTIELRASQREGSIFIEISDDGRGLDLEAIKAKALDRDLIPEGASIVEQDLYNLIFEPGFSTASQIDEISGRGVGLDVVRSNLNSLGGNVEVNSFKGSGTCFRLRVPLTLAIIDVMKVRISGEIYMLPLLSIIRQFRPQPGEIHTVEGRSEVIKVIDNFLPLIHPARLFNLQHQRQDPCEGLVLILENDGRQYGLVVDEILGQDQAVIKALDQNYRRVDGISGASIMGDGRVSMILDVNGMEQMAFSHEKG